MPTLRETAGVERAEAEELDRRDGLAGFIDEFVPAQPAGLIYLDGNSLGRLPRRTAARLKEVIEHEWGERLIRSWDDWMDLPTTVGDELGTNLLGAKAGHTAIADSTTVNLFKLATAALTNDERKRNTILTTSDNFPTDRYLFDHIADVRYLDTEAPTPQEIAEATKRHDIALVSLSHVSYKSGALLDAEAITQQAHANHAKTLWDLSHSAGAVTIQLDDWQVDYAAGCTYKYLNGGPGSPAFLYVGGPDQGENPIPGWFGAADQFAMGPTYRPAPDGVRRFLSGTPPILGLVGAQEGIRLSIEAGIAAIQNKGNDLTDYAIRLHDAWLEPQGVELATPRERTSRGHHVALRHPNAEQITKSLIDDHDVVPDFRMPDIIRLGLSPLTTRFSEIWDAMAILRDHPLLCRPDR